MSRSLSAYSFLASTLLSTSYSSHVDVDVNPATGQFKIQYHGKDWFESGEYYIRSNNKKYSTSDGSLSLSSVASSAGIDGIGKFDKTDIVWSIEKDLSVVTSIREYEK
jgi:hypothetical protein